ncbi:MAG: FAD-dependent oxidoreductase [Halofilum sp. (in: g-proteobacteria)]|nr:FAD-dependent oxidoreductase [Halofilum sp. (in: g-proteobacteria)]
MTHDALVIGSGIVGSFTALALHERGLRVAVIDRGGLAPGTSRSSDGNLLCSDKSPGPMLTLSERSLRLWHRFVGRYGNACEFDPKGSTLVAQGTAQAEALQGVSSARTAATSGSNCRLRLTEALASRSSPTSDPDTTAVGHWPDDRHTGAAHARLLPDRPRAPGRGRTRTSSTSR